MFTIIDKEHTRIWIKILSEHKPQRLFFRCHGQFSLELAEFFSRFVFKEDYDTFWAFRITAIHGKKKTHEHQ